MNRVYGSIAQVIVLVVVMLFSAFTAWAEIIIEDVQATDVTSSGFAVIWQTSESAMPGIAVFSDAAGTEEITGDLEITLFPMHGGDPEIIDEYQMDEEMDNLRDRAKLLGLMKIGIHGCIPDTRYYYRVYAEANGDTASWPAGDPLFVTTTSENSFVSDSKQLLLTLYNDEGTLDAAGWMVTASSSETLFPVSAFVGDGAGAEQAYLNLSQLFGADGFNWTPIGTKEILLEVRGSESGTIAHSLSLDFSQNFYVSMVYPVEINVDEPQDTDGDGLLNYLENRWCTDRFDADSDDDGILDGIEDANHNGVVDEGETDPCNIDTDGDGIQDGTELGITVAVPDPDGEDGPLLGTDTDVFIPDADSNTTTNPLNADSDSDGAWDGAEDANHNGMVDSGETDPNNASSYPAAIIHLKQGFNLIAIPADVSTQSDLADWLPVLGDSSEIEKVMAYDEANNRFITLIPEDGSNPSFTLEGGEGLIVYAKEEKQVGFESVNCSSLNLEQGFNLIGIACPTVGHTAFDLLSSLGSGSVSSIQRYSTEKGAFETAGFDPEGQLVGVDFLIVPGEGYFVYMKQ